jgi:methylenetetrahydrofolate reductase (NADPH)
VNTGQPSIADLLRAPGPTLSFEFFPPQTDAGEQALWRAIRELEPLRPGFVSVTYGAGGSTRDRTTRVTQRIAAETTLTAMAHLTCVGASRAELRRVIACYADAGIRNILALRGDPTAGPGTPWISAADGLTHADELVAMIRSLGSFAVGVAAFPDGHPESADRASDIATLRRKSAAGAQFAVTQFFFDADSYLRLRDAADADGIDLPITPGLMPVTNVAQIERFAALSGAAFPTALAERLHAVAHDEEAVRAVGVEVAAELGGRLLAEGAPGLHFYTLNRSTATREVAAILGLLPR